MTVCAVMHQWSAFEEAFPSGVARIPFAANARGSNGRAGNPSSPQRRGKKRGRQVRPGRRKRLRRTPVVVGATVAREDVIAPFVERVEVEIIALPEKVAFDSVEDVSSEALPPPTATERHTATTQSRVKYVLRVLELHPAPIAGPVELSRCRNARP